MQRAISAVESNSVPSQSKTIRSKRRGGHGVEVDGRARVEQALAQSAGSGASSSIASPLAGWSKRSRRACRNMRSKRVPGARAVAARQRPVEREVAVLLVADDRMAGMREVDADLVRAAGLDASRRAA